MANRPHKDGRDVASVLNGAEVAVANRWAPTGANGTGAQPTETPYDYRQHVRSARELQQKKIFRKPDVVEHIIPFGLTALGGRPKAGKSALMLQVALGLAGMLPTVLGTTCATGRVLYLALEENERRLQDRIRNMLGIAGRDEHLHPIPWPEQFHYITADDQWPDFQHGGLARISEYVHDYRDTVAVLIDSAPLFRGPIPKQGGYDVDYQYTNALAAWVNTSGVSLVVTWHTTKAKMTDDPDADPLALLQNTTGIAAGLDTGLVMARKDGVMMLYRRGRDLDHDYPLKLRDDPDTLVWTPDKSLGGVVARDAVLQALFVAKKPLKPREIASLMGITPSATRKAIVRMMEEPRPPIALCDAGYYLTTRDENNQPREQDKDTNISNFTD